MKERPFTLQHAIDLLGLNDSECNHKLQIHLSPITITIHSNSAPLIHQLEHYFRPVLHQATAEENEHIEVTAIESPIIEPDLPFTDWAREPGKTGRKDAYYDFPDGHLVQKVRTGMLFLQSNRYRIAAGHCLQYDNQLINFINSQYMNWLQHGGALIGHAAGLTYRNQGIAIAGFSGGGKSTLMLHLLENPEMGYITNDRLLMKVERGQCIGHGIAKWPRVNPGTIINNPRLSRLIDRQRREELMALPTHTLWELEEKHDVDIETLYGSGRIVLKAPIHHLLLLNWQRDSSEPTSLQPISLEQRTALLDTILKSPGPFHQHRNGLFEQDTDQPDRAIYFRTLTSARVYEATGMINFEQAGTMLLEQLALS